MNETINKIDIVFENCEAIHIPITDVSYISLDEITESIWHNNILYKQKFEFKLNKIAKKAWITIIDKPEYERVKQYKDITYIDFMNNDESVCYIGIEWFGEDKYNNPKQEIEVEKDKIRIYINVD